MNGQAESDISIVGPGANSTTSGMMRPQDLLSQGGLPNQLQLPQALQNLQRILQSQLGNVSPMHLQRALQKQQVIRIISIVYQVYKNKFYHALVTAFLIACKSILATANG